MSGARPLRLTSIALVLSNLVPVYGVLALGWRVFDVVALYWFENVVIGGFNVLKMLLCSPDMRELSRLYQPPTGSAIGPEGGTGEFPPLVQVKHVGLAMNLAKLFLIPFFAFHYGLFTFVHGVFLVSMLGTSQTQSEPLPWTALQGGGLLLAAACMVASHGVSFVTNFLLGGEFRRTSLPQQMFSPYARVVVLHVAILFGAFATFALGSPMGLLLLLIAGKIVLDLRMHRRSHAQQA